MIKKLLTTFFAGFPFIVLNGDEWHMMGEWSHMMDWWGVPFMGFWIIGIIIGIGLLIVYLIIKSEETEEKEIMTDAQKILDERYAKGEMTRREYIQAKEDIKDFKPK